MNITIKRQNVCRNVKTAGVHFDGAMCERFLTTQDKLYLIRDDLTFRQAVLAEPYTIGVQVNERAKTAPGDVVLIHGAGPIGLIVMDIARQLGATCIISEIKQSRLDIAKNFGAEHIINPSHQNLHEEVERITSGAGPDIIIDAAGIPSVLSDAVDMVAPGGTIVNMCFSPKSVRFSYEKLAKKGIRIIGSRLQNDKFSIVLNAYADRLKAAESIITHEFTVDDGATAFKLFASGPEGAGKMIVTF